MLKGFVVHFMLIFYSFGFEWVVRGGWSSYPDDVEYVRLAIWLPECGIEGFAFHTYT